MLGDMLTQDPNQLREQARRCRFLAKTAIEPEVIEQLRVWSVELADKPMRRSNELPRTTDLIYRSSPSELTPLNVSPRARTARIERTQSVAQ